MRDHTPGPCGCRLGWSKGGTGTSLPPPDTIIYCRTHAAAPDLLAALEAVLPVAEVSYDGDPWFWDDGGDGKPPDGPSAEERIAQARAAIAKAKEDG